jgi:hypothetical protein
MAEPSTFQAVVTIASGILTILSCLLLIAITIGGVVAWRGFRRARVQLAVVQRDVTPLLATMARVATNLEVVTATVRSDIDAIHATVSDANDRARAALDGAEDRLRRLDSVVGRAQDEVESALVDVVAAARGVRTGAAVLRGIFAVGAADDAPDEERPRPRVRSRRGRS